jgi:hypothetical protein
MVSAADGGGDVASGTEDRTQIELHPEILLKFYKYRLFICKIYYTLYYALNDCCDDLRRTAGRSWMRVAEDRARWRDVGEAYVQQWTVIG